MSVVTQVAVVVKGVCRFGGTGVGVRADVFVTDPVHNLINLVGNQLT